MMTCFSVESTKMAMNLKDIAILAGVSESTVSLALNNKSVVSLKTRKRIKEIAEQVGYSPNAFAQSLARKRSNTMGLVVPDIENPYYGRLISCVDSYLTGMHYNLIVATSNDSLANECRIIDNFISERVEGVIIAPTSESTKTLDYISKLEMNHIKYVFVSAYYHGFPASHVMADLENGSFELVDYLIGLGHRRIFFLVGRQDAIPTKMRVQGYVKAFKKHNLPVNKSRFVSCHHPNFEEAYVKMQSLLTSKKRIDAVITLNDIMALGALRCLLENGIRIPEQMSLAGYDNVIFSSIASIPITTVEQDIEGMAVAVVDMLLHTAEKEMNQEKSCLLKTKLIVRNSTGPRVERT